MRVATFNIRHGARNGVFANNKRLAQTCELLDADVVCLQEVDAGVIRSGFRNQARFVARQLGHDWAFERARRMLLTGFQGNAILTRGDIMSHRVLALVRQPGDEQRVATIATLRIYGRTLTVANTHLQNTTSRKGDAATLQQFDQVLDALDDISAPCVLCGDLNLDRGLIVPRLEGRGFSCGQRRNTIPAQAPRSQIDYVAVRGAQLDRLGAGPESVSDHLPLCADISGV